MHSKNYSIVPIKQRAHRARERHTYTPTEKKTLLILRIVCLPLYNKIMKKKEKKKKIQGREKNRLQIKCKLTY